MTQFQEYQLLRVIIAVIVLVIALAIWFFTDAPITFPWEVEPPEVPSQSATFPGKTDLQPPQADFGLPTPQEPTVVDH